MENVFMQSMMWDFNSNLARSKRTLSEIIDSSNRTYRTRDSSMVEIPEEQLQFLWDVCDDSQRISLRLPIYVSTDISNETSAWKVEGRIEALVTAMILGKKLHKGGGVS